MDDTECAVCMAGTCDRLQPCGHVVCTACFMRWVTRSPTCPLCRGVVIGTSSPDGALREHDGSIVLIEFGANLGRESPRDHAGITLTSHGNDSVRVRRVVRRDMAYSAGMRVGDVLTHINGVPVNDHATAVAMIDRATQSGATLAIRRRERQRSRSGLLRRVFRSATRLENVRVS